ncbi:hypothetical protein [Nocardioides acrostichi]|uniref:Uncharacterized protein n=1 Tax=Nocardioides acrostichi TaxID=2784339 RepID=A0A930UXF3_9ACTN|nr:hypothetical protein [Nocardioides acrostichi]MBF4160840.1 hypothetical protein [Nocardioides acrostichi]
MPAWIEPTLLALAVVALLGLVAAVVLGTVPLRGRRHARAAIACGVVGLVVLAGLETVPRVAAGHGVGDPCLGGAIDVSFAGRSVTQQLLTGGLEFDVHVTPQQLQTMVGERLAGSQVSDPTVRLAAGALEIDATVDSPLGSLPVVVRVAPESSGGGTRLALDSVSVGGQEIPKAALGMASQLGGAGDLLSGLDEGLAGAVGTDNELASCLDDLDLTRYLDSAVLERARIDQRGLDLRLRL